MSDDRNSFWAYSLRFYDDPKTQRACLDAQFQLNADINIILYILFKAKSGQRLTLNAIRGAEKNSAPWRSNIVEPLRQIRRSLKKYPYCIPDRDQASFRAAIKKIEVTSERLQQEYLESFQLESDTTNPTEAAQDNLAAYFDILGTNAKNPTFSILLQRFDTLQQKNNV